ncbi:MAG: hypothetical protein V3R50_02410 [Gammaproteobacteria bacterium]
MLTLTITVVLLGSVAVAFFFYAKRPAAQKSKVATRLPFSAVEISLGAGSCEAARELVDQKLLAKDAPSFPLPGCTQQCNCAWKKFRDRRQLNRRRADDGLGDPIVFADTDSRLGDDDRRS